MPRITPDWQPSEHAHDLLYRRIEKAEIVAGKTPSTMITKPQVKVMMESETDKMRLYFLTKYEKGKLISRTNWDLTWLNWMERYYENNRHKRTDSGTGGFTQSTEAYGKLMNPEPLRKHRVPTAEDSIARFEELERSMNK